MSCIVTMDLRAKTKVQIHKWGKIATLICEFCGRYNSKNTVDIEVVVNRSAAFGKPLDLFMKEYNEHIAASKILRVVGALEKIAEQDRKTGHEIETLRLFAYHVIVSDEVAPLFSNVSVTGNVKKLTDSSFMLSSPPNEGNEKNTWLNLLANQLGGAIQRVRQLRIKENSYVTVVGKLEAGNRNGLLFLKLYDINYAAFPERKEGA